MEKKIEDNYNHNLIYLYRDGDQWCAIYPMGSNIMDCIAVAFSPINIVFNEMLGRSRDYGKWAVLGKIKKENPNITTSFYCEYFD